MRSQLLVGPTAALNPLIQSLYSVPAVICNTSGVDGGCQSNIRVKRTRQARIPDSHHAMMEARSNDVEGPELSVWMDARRGSDTYGFDLSGHLGRSEIFGRMDTLVSHKRDFFDAH
jgi:hypothetical protein